MKCLSPLLLALLLMTMGICVPAVGHAQDDPLADCFWDIPKDALFREVNFVYWRGQFTLPDDDQLVMHGQYPYTRGLSIGLYIVTTAGGRTLVDLLPDEVVNPDEGSDNPFLPKAKRDTTARDYTLKVVHGSPPDPREPNTLYLKKNDDGSFNNEGELFVRYYLPDQATPIGGVALPEVYLLHDDGSTTDLTGDCPDPESTFSREDPDDWEQDIAPGPITLPLPQAITRPLTWYAYLPAPGSGGGDIYVNSNNSYGYGIVHVAPGEVLLLESKAPTNPETYEGKKKMGKGEVRYWSFSAYQWGTNRSARGIFDEQIIGEDQGEYYKIVLSTPEDRPSNAVPECGVAWLDVNPSSVTGNSVIVMRHVLPDPSFPYTPMNAGGWFGMEEAMGPYLPQDSFMSVAAFEARGCYDDDDDEQ